MTGAATAAPVPPPSLPSLPPPRLPTEPATLPKPAAPQLDALMRVEQFPYKADFDGGGIVHHLGTAGGTRPFRNPAEAGDLAVTASSLNHDSEPASAIVGDQVVRCSTKPQQDAWFHVDLGARRVRPTHYSLRHYSSWDTEALRNWVLEASVDGKQWTVLRAHTGDAALDRRGATHTWPLELPAGAPAYRHFRVRQTGLNSNRHYYLALSGFELHGALYTPSDARAPALPVAQAFAHQRDFDANGIVHHLATDGGRAPYVNPVDRGALMVTASSVMPDSLPPSAVVGGAVVRFSTRALAGSWVAVDFGKRRVMPTHYSLRHYASWDTEALRSWVLEASVDGAQWTVLVTHAGDAALAARGATATWAIPPEHHATAFRLFRVRQTGVNSNQHHYLALSGFELYGTLIGP